MVSRRLLPAARLAAWFMLITTSLGYSQDKPKPSGGKVVTQKTTDNLDNFLRQQMKKRGIPGLQVAVIHHQKIVLLAAYGLANIQDAVPVTDQTLFSINSITKAFVGVATMQLVEAGKMELESPVSRYLDSLPPTWQPVTIRQLLIHTSGIPNIMAGNEKMVREGEENAAWTQVQTLPMEFAPGEQFSYNQTNYLLLGKVIDKLSAEPFTQFIQERQLNTVGMPLTIFGDAHDVVPHSARGYTFFHTIDGNIRRTAKLSNVFEEFPPFLRTAAGMSSTAKDMANWIIALQQGRLLKTKTSLTTLWTPGLLNNGSPGGFGKFLNGYALGWPTVTREEHRAVASVGGGRSALFIYPDDDLAVVILTNLQGGSPESFIDEVAGYYLPDMRAANGFGLPPAIKALRAELLKRDFEHAPEVVQELMKKDTAFRLTENDLNGWGYTLLNQGKTKEALEIFKLNVGLYPASANTYDSLAETYEQMGNRVLAIKNYQRSLELNPKSTHAIEHLKKLESTDKPNSSN